MHGSPRYHQNGEELTDPVFLAANAETSAIDNEAAFLSAEFQEKCKNDNIQHTSGGSYDKRMNGQVERQNQYLYQQLKLLQMDTAYTKTWVDALPMIAARYNMNWVRVINQIPYFLVFGRYPKTQQSNGETTEDLHPELMRELESMAAEYRKKASQQDYKKKRVEQEVDAGDFVWWLPEKQMRKMEQYDGEDGQSVEATLNTYNSD